MNKRYRQFYSIPLKCSILSLAFRNLMFLSLPFLARLGRNAIADHNPFRNWKASTQLSMELFVGLLSAPAGHPYVTTTQCPRDHQKSYITKWRLLPLCAYMCSDILTFNLKVTCLLTNKYIWKQQVIDYLFALTIFCE